MPSCCSPEWRKGEMGEEKHLPKVKKPGRRRRRRRRG
jgi:hypothetical protein